MYDFDPSSLVLYGLSGSYSITAAKDWPANSEWSFCWQGTYTDEGNLTPRNLPNALIDDIDKSLEQVVMMTQSKTDLAERNHRTDNSWDILHSWRWNHCGYIRKSYQPLLKEKILRSERFSSTRTKAAGIGGCFPDGYLGHGPALAQTAVFTSQLRANFGFIILATILLWYCRTTEYMARCCRIIIKSAGYSEHRVTRAWLCIGGADYALGGLAFNIGNIAGCGMALMCWWGWTPKLQRL